MKKETFLYKGTNTSAITPGSLVAFQDIDTAEKNNNLPHNALTVTNMSDTVEIFVFLDNAINPDVPDYVIPSNTSMGFAEEEGITYHTLFIKNTHGANDVAINELKFRLSTVKEVS
ncbi:hypothetical protein GOV10_01030 [Candidatus Woesearchaeota archaeon]|nr:hypothetical protein [Candidatus Woesearchaeota archaeon]